VKRLFSILVLLLQATAALAWGQKGHDVTAFIAECHLTPRAAARVAAVLDGHSPVYYANWADNVCHTDEYRYTAPWHYANIDEGKTFETMRRNPAGDVVSAVEMIVDSLKSGSLSPESEAFYLKHLIHFLGDIHCPMHSGHLTDRGGNDIPVLFFNSATNLHSVWDTKLVEAARKWSYTEWKQQIDIATDPEREAISAGTPAEWLVETNGICTGIYEATPAGTKISFDYIAEYTPVIERQFLRGGYRLARLLNEIYDR